MMIEPRIPLSIDNEPKSSYTDVALKISFCVTDNI